MMAAGICSVRITYKKQCYLNQAVFFNIYFYIVLCEFSTCEFF